MTTVNQPEEIWKPVKDFEGYYEVSNLGRVKRLKGYQCLGERILKPSLSIGYSVVNLQRPGKRKVTKVHSLVMRAFVSQRPRKQEVNHKDGNKSNNHLANLEYVTRSQNQKHAFENGLNKPNRIHGEEHGRAKVSSQVVKEIRRLAAQKLSQYEIARRVGIKQPQVSRIVNRKLWQHIE